MVILLQLVDLWLNFSVYLIIVIRIYTLRVRSIVGYLFGMFGMSRVKGMSYKNTTIKRTTNDNTTIFRQVLPRQSV